MAAAEMVDDADEAELFAEERAVIANAVPKRRAEFTAVRVCARRALAQLGRPPAAILPGEKREPRWPPGVVGSMTHCTGYRAAAVADASDILALGIDAEPHAPLPDGVLDAVSLPDERDRLAALRAAGPETHWDRLLFCTKESVYKAWYPLARRWLGFSDADVTLEPAGRFTARLLVPGPVVAGWEVTGFEGRWLVRNGTILTVISVAP